MEDKPMLFLDFDSVIVDTNKAFCEYYNQNYHKEPGYEFADHTTCSIWNFEDTCPLAQQDVDTIFGTKELFNRLEMFDNAYETLKKLSKVYEIVIVSVGTFLNVSEKTKWIRMHLPFISEVIMLGKENGAKMGKATVNMEGGIFIDDVKLNLDSSNADVRILYGKKFDWNEEWKGAHVGDWDEIAEYLL